MSLPVFQSIGLLLLSNIFMTFAWYGHLKVNNAPLWIIILASWGIAFFEYCFQVPANRIGYTIFSAAELKAIQEVITLTIFVLFSVFFLGETLRWQHIAGFVLIFAGACFIFYAPKAIQ